MRHQYTRVELESITQETAIYIEGAGIAPVSYTHLKAPLSGVRDRRAARETFVYLHFITIRKESQMKLYQKRNGNMSNQDWLDLGTLLLKLGYVVSIGKEKQSGSMYRSYIEIQGNGLEKEEL